MSREKTTLEIIAPSIDEAINSGLSQLGLPREAVEIEVLDSGNRGLFGLGGRQARVRITIPPLEGVETQPPANVREPRPTKNAIVEDQDALQIAAQVVHDLLERLKVRAQVSACYQDECDPYDRKVIQVEIRGDDLSFLIGRQSETLNALQYISGLIVGKELGEWVPLMIDVQGYRTRRERQLRQLARQMAEQAIATGRQQVLEPMPSNERRLIHLELRDHGEVITESVGEEPTRKVTILLKTSRSNQPG